jgi:hypothetical protein
MWVYKFQDNLRERQADIWVPYLYGPLTVLKFGTYTVYWIEDK